MTGQNMTSVDDIDSILITFFRDISLKRWIPGWTKFGRCSAKF